MVKGLSDLVGKAGAVGVFNGLFCLPNDVLYFVI